MIEITVSSVDEMEALSDKLLKEHYQELTLHKEYVKLDPDWEKYRRLEQNGGLLALVAKDEGLLVGYAVFFIFSHMHYNTTKMASNDVLFLTKEYRKGTTAGIRLIKESEKKLAEIGVKKVIWHVKYSNDFSPILKRMGYVNEEMILGRILEV